MPGPDLLLVPMWGGELDGVPTGVEVRKGVLAGRTDAGQLFIFRNILRSTGKYGQAISIPVSQVTGSQLPAGMKERLEELVA